MAYTISKSGEITISGFEKGIASSPHNGIANIQNANISTEQGEVMCSFGRVQQSQATLTNPSLTALDSTHVQSTLTYAGVWITTAGSGTITGINPSTDYYVLSNTGSSIQLSLTYNGAPITGLGTTGTYGYTIKVNMSESVHTATEIYSDGTMQQYRYYVLDSAGIVWVKDTGITTAGIQWFLPDTNTVSTTSPGSTASGITVLNGWVIVFSNTAVWCKSTSLLGSAWALFTNLVPLTPKVVHYAFGGHQGRVYYTDGDYIGSIFPNTTLLTGGTTPNVQSYASYTAVTTTGTISTLIAGSVPSALGLSTGLPAIPVIFFTGGTKPTAITVGSIYWILYKTLLQTFEVYPTSADATAGTNKIDIATGAVGTQYFNTFYPISVAGNTAILTTPQRLVLPYVEIAQYMVEIGNNVIIGCKSNILYFWNQISNLPQDLIPLPESDVQDMVTVNNMAYIFAGYKGNIYVTNGNTASAVISVPDYCAGINGTAPSYIEPNFIWGDAIFMRGRIYFSIQDQTSTKAGNCGGIWSFVPTQNMFIGQDTGLSLRLENQNSYGTYNGIAGELIASFDQNAKSPQYFSAWKSNSFTSPTYGIDFTATTPIGVTVIETDLIPTGTVLDKKTFSQVEYKLSSPLVAGESVSIKYRQNSTDAWLPCNPAIVESNTDLSGYFSVNFEKGQWLQLQITLTPITSANSSFIRLKSIIIR